MSVSKSLWGGTATIPQKGETGWGNPTTTLLVDIVDWLESLGFLTAGDKALLTPEVTDSSLAAGATLTPLTPIHRVQGSGGAVTLDATTAIADGQKDGQILILIGDHATNTVTVPNGANTDIETAATLSLNRSLFLQWDAGQSLWVEVARRGPQSDLYVNVKATPYNAVGDGVTDDTAAIQAANDAVEAAGGGVVFFPEGTYIVTALTVDSQRVEFLGVGRATILKKTSGTTDFITVTANGCSFRRFRIEGPNNTGADGIAFDNCSDFLVEDVEGFQLSTTVTVGLTIECTDGRIVRVHSDSNTQQGVHLNKAQRVEVIAPTSVGIGTTAAHHGVYVGNCRDVVVTDPLARDGAGTGVHVFAQSSYAARGIIVKGARCSGNGTVGSGNRAGILVSAESGSTIEDMILDACYCFGNGGFNYLIGGVVDIDVVNCIANGNAKATTHGFYAESVVAGNRSYRFRGCASKDHENGVRLVFNSGTIDECLIDGMVIDGNTTGINASGAAVANIKVSPTTRFRGNGTLSSGTMEFIAEFGGDANLYRSAADTLKTDDALTVGGALIVLSRLRTTSPSNLVIASGSITPTACRHTVDTEGAAGSDDLDFIDPGSNGDILILSTQSSARDVRLRDATVAGGGANISLLHGSSVTLDTVEHCIVLEYRSGPARWCEVASTGLLDRTTVPGFLNIGTPSILTIATGVVTATKTRHTIAAESGTADTLSTINGGAEGDLLVLGPDSGDTITVDNAGNIVLSASPFVMNSTGDRLILERGATNWLEWRQAGL